MIFRPIEAWTSNHSISDDTVCSSSCLKSMVIAKSLSHAASSFQQATHTHRDQTLGSTQWLKQLGAARSRLKQQSQTYIRNNAYHAGTIYVWLQMTWLAGWPVQQMSPPPWYMCASSKGQNYCLLMLHARCTCVHTASQACMIVKVSQSVSRSLTLWRACARYCEIASIAAQLRGPREPRFTTARAEWIWLTAKAMRRPGLCVEYGRQQLIGYHSAVWRANRTYMQAAVYDVRGHATTYSFHSIIACPPCIYIPVCVLLSSIYIYIY